MKAMKGMPYTRIAYEVLSPFLEEEVGKNDLISMLDDAYDDTVIPTRVQHLTGKTHILWLTRGPTYSFKDYAARFFGWMLNYFLKKSGLKRVVAVATSGDTGGAVADADRFTSANSISVGRLLPQAVYPFFAYSRVAEYDEPLIASVPSGNFGDMMGTVLAREMGLPLTRIICGVNENDEFPEFLNTEKYVVKPSRKSPSSAMIVSNPSNFARLIDLYGGHVYDQRYPHGKVSREGVMDVPPDLEAMRKDFWSISVKNADHYTAIREVYERYGIMMEPHGAVGWRALDSLLQGKHDRLSVIYETADPGKFPDDVKKAIDVVPDVPERIAKQTTLPERIYSIDEPPFIRKDGSLVLSDGQYEKAKEIMRGIFASK